MLSHTQKDAFCPHSVFYMLCTIHTIHMISLTDLASWSAWCRDCVLCQVQTKFLYVRLTKLVPLKPCPCAQVSHRHLTKKAGCDRRPFPLVLMVDIVAVGQVLLPVLQFFPVSIIPPMLHAHVHLRVSLARRTNGRSLGTFQEGMLFHISGSFGLKCTFTFLEFHRLKYRNQRTYKSFIT
jgi:hypothetical protein